MQVKSCHSVQNLAMVPHFTQNKSCFPHHLSSSHLTSLKRKRAECSFLGPLLWVFAQPQMAWNWPGMLLLSHLTDPLSSFMYLLKSLQWGLPWPPYLILQPTCLLSSIREFLIPYSVVFYVTQLSDTPNNFFIYFMDWLLLLVTAIGYGLVSYSWVSIFPYFIHLCCSSAQNSNWHIAGTQ